MAIQVSGTTVIDNSRNIINVGNIGDSNTVYFGDAAGLNGVELGTHDFVASGNIPNGAAVIVNTDGTVSVVSQTIFDPSNVGTANTFASSGIRAYPSSVYDPVNNKVVVVYADDNSPYHGKAIVGTVSGTTINFGTPVTFDSGSIYYISSAYDSTNQRVIIAYKDFNDSNKGKCIAGTVNGNSINFGSSSTFSANTTDETSVVYDPVNQKVVILWVDSQVSNFGKSVVGTVNPLNNTISIGSAYTFNTASTANISTVYDSNRNRIVVAYRDNGNNGYGTAKVGRINTTLNTMLFTGSTVFISNSVSSISAVYDSDNNSIVIAYRDDGDSNKGKVVVGSVNELGTIFNFGTPVTFESGNTSVISSTYDSNINKVVIAYRSNSNGTAVVGTTSGISSSISFNTPFVFASNDSVSISQTFDPTNNKLVIVYADFDNSRSGEVVVLNNSTSSLTAENYVGIAGETISNGATGKINIVTGINTGQSGLTTSKKYYVQRDGTLDTTAGNPSVIAGTSISSTEIVVK